MHGLRKPRADEVLRQRGFDPNSYRTATIFTDFTDPVTNEFLRQRVGIARLNEIYATQVPGAIWQVRYFRDSQPEEYSVKLKPDGSLAGIQPQTRRECAGSFAEQRRGAGESGKVFARSEKARSESVESVEANSDKRVHRTDHELTWQQRTPIDSGSTSSNDVVSHAYLRIKLAVLGDEVSEYRGSYYSKPEARDQVERAKAAPAGCTSRFPTSGGASRRRNRSRARSTASPFRFCSLVE